MIKVDNSIIFHTLKGNADKVYEFLEKVYPGTIKKVEYESCDEVESKCNHKVPFIEFGKKSIIKGTDIMRFISVLRSKTFERRESFA